jgi:hypothetical protein
VRLIVAQTFFLSVLLAGGDAVRSHCVLNPGLLDPFDQHLFAGLIVERHGHPACVHCPLLDPALRQALGHLQVSRLAPLVPAQVLKKRLALTGFRDGKHFVHRWRDDTLAALPEILGMAVGQVGIGPFDAERLKRQHILRERLRASELRVDVVDLLDGKHDRSRF